MAKTVCAKIPDEMKEEIDNEDINISETIRGALADELSRRRRAKIERDVSALGDRIEGRVDADDVAEAVRETRQEN